MSVISFAQHGCTRALRHQSTSSRISSAWTQHKHTTIRPQIVAFTINHHKRLRLSAPSKLPPQRRYASDLIALSSAVNPPASTRSAPLTKPQRGSDNVFAYLWRVARAYGGFYKTGVKAIFSNRKLAQEVRQRLEKEIGTKQSLDIADNALLTAAVSAGCITRAEYQLLRRNWHDMKRVPLFLVLVALLGEWLVFIVPFVPYMPPLTCRIPDVVQGMRDKTEQRRSRAFRKGTQEPDLTQIPRDNDKNENAKGNQPQYGVASPQHARKLVQALRPEQLYHLSCVLNLHSRAWEGVQLAPPAGALRGRIAKRLTYLTQDDELLNKDGRAEHLDIDELAIACEERGLDVLHPYEDELRTNLQHWLDNQKADNGSGVSLLDMLFKRPNAWKTA